jgi:hypothetical protein
MVQRTNSGVKIMKIVVQKSFLQNIIKGVEFMLTRKLTHSVCLKPRPHIDLLVEAL